MNFGLHNTKEKNYQHNSNLLLHTGAMMRDLAVGQYPTQKDQCSSTHIEDSIATNLEHYQEATSDVPHHCTVSDCSLTTKCSLAQDCRPIPLSKKLFHKLENTVQTYINYCKTHATHYGGMGDTSMENPETQDIDNDSQDNFQEENIIQQLICKTEQLRQTREDRDNDPRDVIHQLEQKLNQLTLTLHPPSEPIEEVLDKYMDTLCNAQKKTSLESSLL